MGNSKSPHAVRAESNRPLTAAQKRVALSRQLVVSRETYEDPLGTICLDAWVSSLLYPSQRIGPLPGVPVPRAAISKPTQGRARRCSTWNTPSPPAPVGPGRCGTTDSPGPPRLSLLQTASPFVARGIYVSGPASLSAESNRRSPAPDHRSGEAIFPHAERSASAPALFHVETSPKDSGRAPT